MVLLLANGMHYFDGQQPVIRSVKLSVSRRLKRFAYEPGEIKLAAMGCVQMVEIELWPCQYRLKCTAAGCRNLARIIVLGRWPRAARRSGRASCAIRTLV